MCKRDWGGAEAEAKSRRRDMKKEAASSLIRGVMGPKDGNRSPCVINAEKGKLTYKLQSKNTSGVFTFDSKTLIEYTMIHIGDQRKMRIRFNARCTHNEISPEYDSLADFILDQPHDAREIIRKMRGEREQVVSIQRGRKLRDPTSGQVIKNFQNMGELCYRNCIYSMLLNNEYIQAQIAGLKPEDSKWRPQQRNFIRCLQMIVNPNTASTHPNANSTYPETFGSEILQINTALFELFFSATDEEIAHADGRDSLLDNQPENKNMGSHCQCDADEFLKLFIRALAYIDIAPFKCTQFSFKHINGLPIFLQKGENVPEENERLKEGYTLEELKRLAFHEGISQEKIELHAAVGVDDLVKLIVNNRERNIFKRMTRSVVASGVLLEKKREDALFSQSEIIDSESDSTDVSIFQAPEMLFHRDVESPTGNPKLIPGDWEDKNRRPVDIKMIGALQWSLDREDQKKYRQLLKELEPRRRLKKNPDFKSILDVLNGHNTCSKEVDRYLQGKGITKEVAARRGMSLNQSIREPVPR